MKDAHWINRAAALRLALLFLWLLSAPLAIQSRVWAAQTVEVIYRVDFIAREVRYFDQIDEPLIAPPPAGAMLALRYCANGQARLLSPRIDGNRLRAVLYVPRFSRLCVEVVALNPTPSAADPDGDGLDRVDLDRDQATLAQIIQRVGSLGTPASAADQGLPAWLNYLAVLIGVVGLALAVVYGLFHLLRRLRELSHLVQQLPQQPALPSTLGFVLKELRVESAPDGSAEDAKIKILASDGYDKQSATTTKRRADILRELLRRHPEPVSRFSSKGQQELINPTELTRLRKDLAPLLGELLALQLVQNSQGHVSLNPSLYCPPSPSSSPVATDPLQLPR